MYKTSLFKREKVCKNKILSASIVERISQIIETVNYFSEIYDMPENEKRQLILESILYSYEMNGDQCPKSDTELVDLISKVKDEVKKEKFVCFCFG